MRIWVYLRPLSFILLKITIELVFVDLIWRFFPPQYAYISSDISWKIGKICSGATQHIFQKPKKCICRYIFYFISKMHRSKCRISHFGISTTTSKLMYTPSVLVGCQYCCWSRSLRNLNKWKKSWVSGCKLVGPVNISM